MLPEIDLSNTVQNAYIRRPNFYSVLQERTPLSVNFDSRSYLRMVHVQTVMANRAESDPAVVRSILHCSHVIHVQKGVLLLCQQCASVF